MSTEVPSALPAYADMLLRLATDRPDDDAVAFCRDLIDRDEIDWAAFVDAAGRHKILPLVGKHIAGHHLDRGYTHDGAQGIPYPWLYSYTYLANRQRNLALADECRKVFRALDAAGLRFAVRKGFVVAEHAYHDVGARRINDLDILIERSDAPAAHEVLARIGYAQGKIAVDGDRVEPFSRQTQIFWRTNLSNQLPYVKPGNRPDIPVFNVDLCHHIFQPKSGVTAPTADLLRRARKLPICGDDAWALSPEDHLLDLCAHLYKEATGVLFIKDGMDIQLSKFLDIALTCASYSAADWQRFFALVAGYGAEKIAFYSLHFTGRLYPEAVPALDEIRPHDLGYLDEFGLLDGKPTRWEVGFPQRLFAVERRHEAGESAVLHD
ncbi:nucleotidyltransferase domain-containing protein [Saccharopolyspora phatthalungensis]|uniref:Uncharacterized protein n=1 Tax=Saccharopolyspora phatthalungensis TaxID=664693 RepID=A0A840QKU8_9PSEU|nr:nucleotidyltransferase family protein [Saccharopolyspora phatthalungensis]MBB5159493.1 hypothetical protein [Saccharopolyspora phatthalungensis]